MGDFIVQHMFTKSDVVNKQEIGYRQYYTYKVTGIGKSLFGSPDGTFTTSRGNETHKYDTKKDGTYRISKVWGGKTKHNKNARKSKTSKKHRRSRKHSNKRTK
jgi:hypothetical protein